MQTFCKSRLLGLLAMSVLGGQSAHAITISTIGSYNDPTATDPKYLFDLTYNQDDDATPVNLPISSSTDSVAYYGWGIDLVDSFAEQNLIQSHFWFNGAGSEDGGAAASVPLNTKFSLGTFTYVNEQTILTGGTNPLKGGIVQIDFQMAINIDGLLLDPIEYRIEINNTQEGFINPFDTARIISAPSDVTFMLGLSQYRLNFLGFTQDGGGSFPTYAELAEGGETSAQIYATITAVPVPAAVWLMGSGLLALFGFARTKK